MRLYKNTEEHALFKARDRERKSLENAVNKVLSMNDEGKHEKYRKIEREKKRRQREKKKLEKEKLEKEKVAFTTQQKKEIKNIKRRMRRSLDKEKLEWEDRNVEEI